MIKRVIVVLIALGGVLFQLQAQGPPDPPRPIEAEADHSHPLAFGAFTTGISGGTVSVGTDYNRNSTGTVVLLSLGYEFYPGRIYVRGSRGTLVTVTLSPTVTLTGSGGGILTLIPGPMQPLSPFVLTLPYPTNHELLVGGTLNVGPIGTNPSGHYTGTFNITFNQQ